ncbi:MAG: patatin-like phospholipase family protein [Caldilineaceae bacterium]
MTKPGYFIVSCDGGGIRGLITAMLLENLEARCPGFLGKVALFAGTSTGGIIALGLAAGIDISLIRSIYEGQAADIFVRFQPGTFELLKYVGEYVAELLEPPAVAAAEIPAEAQAQAEAQAEAQAAALAGLSGTLQTIEGVFHVKYKADGLTKVLDHLFKGAVMRHLSPVMVATYNIAPEVGESWQPLLLTNLAAPRNTSVDAFAAGDILALDAALATGAAPTFVPPHNVPGIGFCADGGLFANNPSLFALNSVISRKNPISSIAMLSLGTGNIAQRVGTVADPLAWGVGQWLLPRETAEVPQLLLLQTLMDGQEAIADAQCAKMLRNRYMRVDPLLSAMFPLDGVQFIPKMVEETQAYIDGKPQRGVPPWQDVISWVQANI